MNKKIVTVILAIVMLFVFSSCTKGGETNNSTENKGVEISDMVDFTVEIEDDRNFVVLQLSDTQIIDAAQKRTENRLSASTMDYWATDKIEDRCFKYIRYTVEQSNPDLILVVGDVVYGEFDDKGTSTENFIEFMDSFKIPWAPVIGNHEGETQKGIDWICQKLEQSEYCLFKQRRFEGNGNYSVGLVKDGQLVRVFFMMDSNGYSNMSEETINNKHSISVAGFGSNQIAWYSDAIAIIKENSPKTKLSFVWHIPSQVFINALASKYGHDESAFKFINIDDYDSQTDFGIVNGKVGGVWDKNLTVWNDLKSKGVDSIFVGHVHAISASIIYEGVRLQFGQKSSTYDSANYLDKNGNVVCSYTEVGEPIVGGNVFEVSGNNGEILSPRILLYQE